MFLLEPCNAVFRESTDMISAVESPKKATIKITSNKNNTKKKTTIFLSSKRTIPNNNQPIDDKKQLSLTSSILNTTNKEEECDLMTSSFDSEDCENENSNLESDAGIDEKTPHQEQPDNSVEVHSATYRCIPVYQPEYTKTGTVHAKEALALISEERKSRQYKQREVGRIHKKWGSQTIEPTQDKAEYIPRSAEIINNIKDKLQKVREKKIELLHSAVKTKRAPVLSAAARRESMTRSKSVGYPPEQENEQAQRPKEELPQQTKPSPRVYRRATYGYINKSRTVPVINSAPTSYERNTEREKIIAFTHALENAAWRKRSVLSVTN